MQGNNLPLALNPWADPSAPNSYRAANEAVDMIFDPEKDDFLKEHPELADFTKSALYGVVTGQSERNFEQYQRVAPFLTEAHTDYIRGIKTPAELTLFLYVTSKLNSIETARRTEKRWNIYNEFDAPVRRSLDNHPLLYTKAIKSKPLYRIKNLNLMGPHDQYDIMVNRKRTVRQHVGGRVLTIVRNGFVLHNHGGSAKLPRDLRKLIHEERDKARSDGAYQYDQHLDMLQEYMEEYITHRSTGVKPDWMMPDMTTYYAARRDVIKAPQLLDFSETDVEETA